MSRDSLNVQSWLKEGFILQIESDRFVLGEGPFHPSSRPCEGFYYRDFFSKKTPFWFYSQKIHYLKRAEIESFLGKREKSSFLNFPAKQPSFIEFQNVFYEIKNKIQQKKFHKSVPVFFEEIEAVPDVNLCLQKLFINTRAKKNQGFIYGCWKPHKGMLGFTPEILFSSNGENLKTMALAGTGSLFEGSLFRDKKEVKEQDFVLKDIKESLQDLVKWKTETSYEKVFFKIKHLCTEIEGELKRPFDFSLLCDRLHPTAALGGYPKKEVVAWLEKHPSQKTRGSFGAPFGFFNGKKQSFCIVGIRGIQWSLGKTYIGSGCGVISESILQKEWRELFLKREQIKNLFQ